jgi:transcriptional regulator with XRE-family HTH domain
MTEARPLPNQHLRQERERRAWSQQDVADKVGTTQLTVGRWERGITMPGPYYRQKLCEIFEKTAQELGLVSESVETEQATPVPLHTSSTISPSQECFTAFWNVP